VVTSSVSIAGVLLVFSFLVIPAVIAVLFVDGIRPRLVVGWIVGTIVSALGCTVSYFRDLPSGPTIVACFGAALLLAGVAHHIAASPARGFASLRVLGGTVVVASLVGGSFLLRKREDHDLVHLLEAGSKGEKMLALAAVQAEPDLWTRVRPLAPAILRLGATEVRVRLLDLVQARRDVSLLDEVHALLGDPDDTIRDRALRCLKALGRPESVEPLIAAARREEDEYLKVEIAEALLELGDPRGFAPMIDVIADGAAPAQARRDAWEHVRAHAILDVALHADLPPEENDKAVADLRRWWAENGAKLVPRPSGIFEAR
jgi:hypothetical protein